MLVKSPNKFFNLFFFKQLVNCAQLISSANTSRLSVAQKKNWLITQPIHLLIDSENGYHAKDYKSFFLNTRNAHHKGNTIHSNIIPAVNKTPVPLPKKSLYKAPV